MQIAELIKTSHKPSKRMPKIMLDRIAVVSTVIALVTGTLLRWLQLGTRSLWFDEGYTAWVVSRPLNEIARIIRADTAPPLYYLLLREWTVLFGRSEVAMRSLSALFATLTLLVFTAIARHLLKDPWAITAAVWMFSLSFMQIAYAHEARFYTMMAFLGGIDLYLVLLVCERSSISRLTVMVLAWSASLYTNNIMAVYLACLGCAWLFAPGTVTVRRRLMDLIIVTVISATAFAPWLPSLRAQMTAVHGHFWAEIPDGLALTRTIAVMAGVHEWSLGRFGLNGLVFVDLAILGLVLAALRTGRQVAMAALLIVFALVPIVFIYLYSQLAQPIYMDRVFLVSGIAFPLLAALPLTMPISGWRQGMVTAGMLTIIVLSARSLPVQWIGTQDEDWRDATRFVVMTHPRHRLVVFVANEGELLYDYYVRGSDYSPKADLAGVPASFFAVDPPHTMRQVESDEDLENLLRLLSTGQFDEVAFVAGHNWFADPTLRTLNLLQSKLALLDKKTISRLTVFRFGTAAGKNGRADRR